MNDTQIKYLMMLFSNNEKYHDTKENRAWIASAFYYSISVTAITALINNRCLIKSTILIVFLVILVLALYLADFLYVLFQFKKKYISVNYHYILMKNIDKLIDTNTSCLESCVHEKWQYLKSGIFKIATEVSVLVLSFIFFICQIVIIFLFIYEPKLLTISISLSICLTVFLISFYLSYGTLKTQIYEGKIPIECLDLI
jgi:hypothetical protein